MASYSEKFSAIHHEYHKSKMKKLSIGTEGFFDFLKKKKKEEPKAAEPKKSIEDFVNLFNEEFSVIEKKIQESEQTEWKVTSLYVGKAKNAQELINSVKAHVVFLKEMKGAMELVIKGINACNEFTKIWSKDPENDSAKVKGIDNIAKYRVEPKHFRSLDNTGKTEGYVALGDKFRSFTFVLEVIDSPHKIDYCDIPVIGGSFNFNKDSKDSEIALGKSEFISFIKELKNVNGLLFEINKEYLNHKTNNFDSVIEQAWKLHDELEETHSDNLWIDEAYGVHENYHQGTYTRVCSAVVEQYVKYMHSFLNEQSKS